MHMMAPIRAGTLSVVCGDEEEEDDAGKRGRQRGDDDEGIEPGLEVDHDQQIDEHDGEGQAGEQAEVGAVHGFDLAAQRDEGAARQVLFVLRRRSCRCARPTAPRSRSCTLP